MFHTFFMFSTGLAKPLVVPKGTVDRIIEQGERTQRMLLGLRPGEWHSAEKRMRHHTPDEVRAAQGPHKYQPTDEECAPGRPYALEVRGKTLCDAYEQHNGFVQDIYRLFEDASGRSPEDAGDTFEVVTPEQARTFWPFLSMIGDIPVELWTREFALARNSELYEALRGREGGDMILGAPPLTTEQAAAVINLIHRYTDPHDQDFEVAKGHDRIEQSGSYDGDGYTWCEHCGAVREEDGCMADTEDEFKDCYPRKNGGGFNNWGNAPEDGKRYWINDEDDPEDEEEDDGAADEEGEEEDV